MKLIEIISWTLVALISVAVLATWIIVVIAFAPFIIAYRGIRWFARWD